MDNLPELRDIHLPTDGISFFPLAYGWWILIVFLLLLLIISWMAKKIWRESARIYAKHLLKPLKENLSIETVIKLSEVLRRTCLKKYPQAVSLSGQEWIDFLNKNSKNKLSSETSRLLLDAPYMNQQNASYKQEDVLSLWQFCADWIGDNL